MNTGCQNYVRVDNRDIRCVGKLGHRGECNPYANPDPPSVFGWEPAPQWAKDAKEDDRKREAR